MAAVKSIESAGGHAVATPDGRKLYVKLWAPVNPKAAVGVVVLVHGLGEHINRYNHVARAFQESGFKVVGFDQRGFGRTPGTRGDSEGYQCTMNDIEQLIQQHYERGLPLFLFGHSMGGLHTLYFVAQRTPKQEREYPLTGVIVSAPALTPGTPPPWLKVTVGRALSAIPILNGFTVNAELDLTTLTRSADAKKAYLEDPLVHPYISLRSAANILDAGTYMLNEGYRKFNKPVLIAFGTADKMTSYQAARDFYDKLDVVDKTFLSFDGLFHELHNEPEQDAVLRSYVAWLLKRTNISKSRL